MLRVIPALSQQQRTSQTQTIRVPLSIPPAREGQQGSRMPAIKDRMGFVGPYDFLAAVRCGRRATRRGDIAEAERWYRLADRALAISQRLSAIQRTDAQTEAFKRGDRHPRWS